MGRANGAVIYGWQWWWWWWWISSDVEWWWWWRCMDGWTFTTWMQNIKTTLYSKNSNRNRSWTNCIWLASSLRIIQNSVFSIDELFLLFVFFLLEYMRINSTHNSSPGTKSKHNISSDQKFFFIRNKKYRLRRRWRCVLLFQINIMLEQKKKQFSVHEMLSTFWHKTTIVTSGPGLII